MDFAQQQHPARNIARITMVVALHVVVGYALLNGLAHKVVEILKKPLDVSLIEEVKAPPPPPKTLPPPPKVALPPPAYVPPAEVQVQSPVSQNVIAVTSSTPAPPVEVAPPPARVAPPPAAIALVCPNHVTVRSQVVFPPQAQRMGISGDVVVEFTVTGGGGITDITVVRSTNPVFNAASTQAVSQLRCNGQGHDVRVRVPFAFRLEH